MKKLLIYWFPTITFLHSQILGFQRLVSKAKFHFLWARKIIHLQQRSNLTLKKNYRNLISLTCSTQWQPWLPVKRNFKQLLRKLWRCSRRWALNRLNKLLFIKWYWISFERFEHTPSLYRLFEWRGQRLPNHIVRTFSIFIKGRDPLL